MIDHVLMNRKNIELYVNPLLNEDDINTKIRTKNCVE